MSLRVVRTEDFEAWYQELDLKTKHLVDARIERIVNENHFGTVKRFHGMIELKWTGGMRVYTALKPPRYILLLGGNKNGQSKDIRKAKKLLDQIEGS